MYSVICTKYFALHHPSLLSSPTRENEFASMQWVLSISIRNCNSGYLLCTYVCDAPNPIPTDSSFSRLLRGFCNEPSHVLACSFRQSIGDVKNSKKLGLRCGGSPLFYDSGQESRDHSSDARFGVAIHYRIIRTVQYVTKYFVPWWQSILP